MLPGEESQFADTLQHREFTPPLSPPGTGGEI